MDTILCYFLSLSILDIIIFSQLSPAQYSQTTVELNRSSNERLFLAQKHTLILRRIQTLFHLEIATKMATSSKVAVAEHW